MARFRLHVNYGNVHAAVTSMGAVLSSPPSKVRTASSITKGGAGEYCINGLLQPNVVAEVQTPVPSGGVPPNNTCKNAQAFVRIIYQTVTGAQGSEHLVRTGQDHGFYLEIN